MRKKPIPRSVRQRVFENCGFRCGYCLTPQKISGARLVVDHIIAEAAGGLTREENLWLACHSCNEFKGSKTYARDPQTRRRVRLFNPRKQRWQEHFAWSEDGANVVGLTPCGRATVAALQLNHVEIVYAREQWVRVGWWPPEE